MNLDKQEIYRELQIHVVTFLFFIQFFIAPPHAARNIPKGWVVDVLMYLYRNVGVWLVPIPKEYPCGIVILDPLCCTLFILCNNGCGKNSKQSKQHNAAGVHKKKYQGYSKKYQCYSIYQHVNVCNAKRNMIHICNSFSHNIYCHRPSLVYTCLNRLMISSVAKDAKI